MICYLDDILVSGRTEAKHLDNLRKVLQKLKDHGIRAKKSKCAFMKASVQYLGHVIDADGLHPSDAKLKAIVNAPTPTNVTELRSFWNYYGRFISNLSTLIHPLNSLLCQDAEWNWSKACQVAFQSAKKKLISPNVLVHYDST